MELEVRKLSVVDSLLGRFNNSKISKVWCDVCKRWIEVTDKKATYVICPTCKKRFEIER